jgi:hypothetical protein
MDEHRLDSLNELLGILRANGATFFEGHGIKVVLGGTESGVRHAEEILEEPDDGSTPEERALFRHVGGVPKFE